MKIPAKLKAQNKFFMRIRAPLDQVVFRFRYGQLAEGKKQAEKGDYS
jgi:hypothetical protein